MRRSLVASALLIVAACGGAPVTTSNPPPAPGTGYRLQTPSITLAGGEEKYFCFTATLQEAKDIAVVKFAAQTSALVHHFEVFQTLATEQAGLFDCSATLIKQSWLPLFGAGAGASGFALPDGAGFRVPKDAQLLLQLHLLNATAAVAKSTVTVDMTYARDAATVTPAGIYAVGSMQINLPPLTNNVVVNSPHCQLARQYDVFAVQPHMHQLGTRIDFTTSGSEATMQTAYKRDPWVFGAQPIDPVRLTLKAGDFVGASCTYDNSTGAAVAYGESSKNEMCYFVLFYTQFDHLDGCVN
jgi:hypothetical protein